MKKKHTTFFLLYLHGPVAQPGRAPRLHRGGFGFESTGPYLDRGRKSRQVHLRKQMEQGPLSYSFIQK